MISAPACGSRSLRATTVSTTQAAISSRTISKRWVIVIAGFFGWPRQDGIRASVEPVAGDGGLEDDLAVDPLSRVIGRARRHHQRDQMLLRRMGRPRRRGVCPLG